MAGDAWVDVDGDGFSDLVLACEWGPIRLFLNDRGALREATTAWGLAELTGLWTGITAGDFDGDGRLDLVAGNWGLNSPYRASPAQPLRLYYGDFDQNGVVDLIEAYDVPGLGLAPRRDFDAVATALPFVRNRFESRRAYAQASVQQILGPQAAKASQLTANTLVSTVFLNRGQRFEPVPLPPEAQYAPAFGVSAGDLDGDGRQDLFLSQNLHATQPDFTRMDAGRGLVLLGDGQGGFSPMPGPESGVMLYGEQRGCALADFDADGRTDLVVTQNGATTALFRNQGARPGLRVRLAGPPANPDGVGAVVQAVVNGSAGPARPVLAGSGFGSQDSATLVLATGSEAPTAIRVRWPGGNTTQTTVPPGTREVVVDAEGGLVTRPD